MGFRPGLARLFVVVYFVVDMDFLGGASFVVGRNPVFGMGSFGIDSVVDKDYVGAGSAVGMSSAD